MTDSVQPPRDSGPRGAADFTLDNIGRHRRGAFAVERIIAVAVGIEGVEGFAVVLVERQSQLDAYGQIWISDEIPAERHQVGIPFLESGERRAPSRLGLTVVANRPRRFDENGRFFAFFAPEGRGQVVFQETISWLFTDPSNPQGIGFRSDWIMDGGRNESCGMARQAGRSS